MRIPESVHAGLDRDGPGCGAIGGGIWHRSRLVAGGDAAGTVRRPVYCGAYRSPRATRCD
ncbi:uvrABC system C domain protein [Mycobacterium avium subsp. avium 2285 (R)]|nr:uvrABC system C domain protein [Mycobacterium avium MAV_120809_2495]ETZ50920.1 uvrABC system C domain protein [Mycobacterium avium MAV_061107_1842]EUA38059.1 uvrABC system C domain protein [Mycobacterium avium subsp. avium 2285 (R)]